MKPTFVFLYIQILLYGCFGTPPELNTGYEGKTMPPMKLQMLDSSTYINTATWQPGKPIILIDISPTCPYCRAMTQKIIDENKKLNSIQFILLSTFPLTDLKYFYNEYQIKDYANITLARDYEEYFGKYFNSPGVPCSAIYGRDRLLKRVIMGKVSVNLLKDIASE